MASIAAFDVWKKSSGATVGTPIQIVNAFTTATTTVTNTSTYAATSLTATITPSSVTSKILVLINPTLRILVGATFNDSGCGVAIYRNGSPVFQDAGQYHHFYFNGQGGRYIANIRARIPLQYYDSPNSTSALTYTLYLNSYLGSVDINADGQASHITLMEIQA